MVRVRRIAWIVAAWALAGVRPALAGPIDLTGNTASDFPSSSPGVSVNWVYEGPGIIAGPTGVTANQLVSGFDIQSVRTSYDAASDTMYVGIQGYQNVAGKESIFGDSSGNPDPSQDRNPNLEGDKAVAIQFAPIGATAGHAVAGTPVLIAGIPADKTKAGSGTTDGFTVSTNTNVPGSPQYSFGQQLPQFTGNLAFNPSAAHPDLEFTIKNFSQVPGLNATNGFYMQVYAGSASDIVAGEVNSAWLKVPALAQENQTPEPTTWMTWAAVCGAGAAWKYRRSRRPRP